MIGLGKELGFGVGLIFNRGLDKMGGMGVIATILGSGFLNGSG